MKRRKNDKTEFPYDPVRFRFNETLKRNFRTIPFYLVRFRFISYDSVLSPVFPFYLVPCPSHHQKKVITPGNAAAGQRSLRAPWEVARTGELLRSPTEWDASPSPTPENTTFKLQRIPDAYQKIQNCVCENTTLGPHTTGCLIINRKKRRPHSCVVQHRLRCP